VPLQDTKLFPEFGVAEIPTLVPASYHPVSPGMDGLVVAVAVPDPLVERISWYCVTEPKVTVCAAVIAMVDVVTCPSVATLVIDPVSICQDETRGPDPADLVPIPFDETVSASPYLYQPSLVSEGLE
jgi:hypothetical protein